MSLSRRQMLFRSATGFGGMALWSQLAHQRAAAARPEARPLAKAKSVIFLYMEGGPSQVDTFDPKPRLAAENGQPMKMKLPLRLAAEPVLASAFKFRRYGECGLEVSELFPHTAELADELCVIRSMVSEHADHGNGNYFMNTGVPQRGRPSIGSWFSYGLGSENQDLPSYVVMNDGEQLIGGPDVLNNGFLPAKHGPTVLNTGREPLPYLRPREPAPALQHRKVETIRRLDRDSIEALGGNEHLESIIENYELAFRMQTAVVDAVDLSQESAATKKLYGLDHPKTALFGERCLRARRLVERGVRFIQIITPTADHIGSMIRWDQHVEIFEGHRNNARFVDKPIAGLLRDLRSRGLLDQTLIVWGGEFGRTPTAQSHFPNHKVGRDHNPFGFTMWLAGGGVKGGMTYGATDEYGFRAVEKPVTVHDLHATILHLCGIDHTELTYRYGGRDFRLTDVYGDVVAELLA
jgi:hypothetical protein